MTKGGVGDKRRYLFIFQGVIIIYALRSPIHSCRYIRRYQEHVVVYVSDFLGLRPVLVDY